MNLIEKALKTVSNDTIIKTRPINEAASPLEKEYEQTLNALTDAIQKMGAFLKKNKTPLAMTDFIDLKKYMKADSEMDKWLKSQK